MMSHDDISHSAPVFSRPFPDALLLAGLIVLVSLLWCLANSKDCSAASWQLPSAYSASYTSDVLGTLTAMKAVSEGHFRPLLWKSIPELGAPSGANWNDYPIIEEIPLFIQGMLAKAFGLFAGLNISLLIGHILAAVTFYLVARILKSSPGWSFAGALAFGLAPYIFAQSPHHINVASAWHIVLFLPVWSWSATGDGIRLWSRRFWIAAGIGFLAGTQNVYYTNIFCQLTLLGGLVVLYRTRKSDSFVSILLVIGCAAAGFALMNLDTWSYRFIHGPNASAVVREYKWLEIYGLKMVDLFIPPLNHHSNLLASFGLQHRQDAPLQDEGSYLGILGILSLLLLAANSGLAVLNKRLENIPLSAWQVLWILFVFTTGGLNALMGSFGFTMFRTGCRYSIVILAIVLMYAVQWLSQRPMPIRQARLMIILFATIAIWDQVPRPPSRDQIHQIAKQIASDRAFVSQMESQMPPGSMVFQIPIMDFPESPIPGLSPYDELRPYLFSKSLRFSFGSMKGRQDTDWQKNLTTLSLANVLLQLKKLGFRAILIHKNGLPDQAKGILQSLAKAGCSNPIQSQADDLACVFLPTDS